MSTTRTIELDPEGEDVLEFPETTRGLVFLRRLSWKGQDLVNLIAVFVDTGATAKRVETYPSMRSPTATGDPIDPSPFLSRLQELAVSESCTVAFGAPEPVMVLVPSRLLKSGYRPGVYVPTSLSDSLSPTSFWEVTDLGALDA